MIMKYEWIELNVFICYLIVDYYFFNPFGSR